MVCDEYVLKLSYFFSYILSKINTRWPYLSNCHVILLYGQVSNSLIDQQVIPWTLSVIRSCIFKITGIFPRGQQVYIWRPCDARWHHISLWLKELIPSLRSWRWHHRLPNVTTTEAHRLPNVTTTEVQPRLWWHLGVCGVIAMTSNSVSISILSWYHKINFKLGVVVKPNCLSAVQV